MQSPRHKNRHVNAYRAGARAGIKDFAETLSKIMPPEYHGDLAKLRDSLLNKEEYQYLMRHEREGTS